MHDSVVLDSTFQQKQVGNLLVVPTGGGPPQALRNLLAGGGYLPSWTTDGRPPLATGQVIIGFNITTQQIEVGVGTSSGVSWMPLNGTSSVPGTPTLVAAGGNGQNYLTWTDGSAGGAPITSHLLYRGTSPGSERLVATITSGSPYVDTGLTNGQTYYYRLSAVNIFGEGAQSAEVTANPSLVASRPSGVTNLAAMGASANSQLLTWAAPFVGSQPISYLVEFRLSGAMSWSTAGASALTSFRVTGLFPATGYDYRVTPSNSNGSGPAATLAGVMTAPAGTADPNAAALIYASVM